MFGSSDVSASAEEFMANDGASIVLAMHDIIYPGICGEPAASARSIDL